MLIKHTLSLDMYCPENSPRLQVKQGDTLSHSLEIQLLAGGEAWEIPGDARPVIRWFACNPDTGETAQGIYDTLPDGIRAWNFTGNQLDIIPVPQMFAMPGIVQADVVFTRGIETLATFNFECYVNCAPADGTEPEAQSYYKVLTLDQVNAAITGFDTRLTEYQAQTDYLLSQLEHRIFGLERIVNEM